MLHRLAFLFQGNLFIECVTCRPHAKHFWDINYRDFQGSFSPYSLLGGRDGLTLCMCGQALTQRAEKNILSLEWAWS